jgi:hypothetical protein
MVEKRTQKLRQTLQMVMLRLRDNDVLQRVEIQVNDQGEAWQVQPDGKLIDQRGKELLLKDFSTVIETRLTGVQRATVRLVERGTLVTIELLANDVKLGFSTLDTPVTTHHQPVESGTRQQFVKIDEAMELLQALEIASPEGKVRADRRRKYYQVDRFVELVDEMLEKWNESRPLTILDCGCGKSYLSFVLNYWLTEKRRVSCRVIGIDGNEGVIQSSRRIQNRLGYRNMDFYVSSILDYVPRGPVDMVLSLHACDTATDEAVALGLHMGSKYIISVPCCQAALRDRIDYSPWQAVARHNIFRNRLSDVLTDGLRVAALEARGYKVSVVEYVSPLDTPKNIMLRAVGRGRDGVWSDYRQLQGLVEELLPVERFLQELNNR